MLLLAALQLVPASLLFYLAMAALSIQAREIPWPYGFRSLQSSAADGGLSRSDGRSTSNRAAQMLVGVRKMSDDGSEMFFPEYWSFEATNKHEPLDFGKKRSTNHQEDWANASISQPLQAPFALHRDGQSDSTPLLSRMLTSPRSIFGLAKRQTPYGACPGGTTICNSIGQPNSCCPLGTICQSITDSGQGVVGCCPSEQTCSEQVAGCPSGDTGCSDSSGGGCCIPGYACDGVGCLANSTVTTTVEPVVTVSRSPSTSAPVAAGSSSPAISSTGPIFLTSTFTAFTQVTSIVTSGTSRDPLTSSSSTRSSTPPPTTSSALIPAVRPTSCTHPTSTTTGPPLTITASQCPTGFYQCSAFDHAGCCQVGRDCALSSCPAAALSTALNSNGVVVQVPSGTQPALGVSGCALGWFSCASGDGGGCCPNGYNCGTSCTATAVVVQGGVTGTAQVAKDNGVGELGTVRWQVWAIATVLGLVLSLR